MSGLHPWRRTLRRIALVACAYAVAAPAGVAVRGDGPPAPPDPTHRSTPAGLVATLDAASDRDGLVLAWLGDDDPTRRDIAAAALATLGDQTLRTALERMATYAPATRQAVLTAASRRMPDAALPACIRLAADPDAAVRVTALECLGLIGGPAAVPPLLAALRDAPASADGDAIRRVARAALAEVPVATVMPRLLEAARARPTDRDLVALCGDTGDRTALPVLAATAAAADPAPWREALAAIQRIAAAEPDDLRLLVDLFARAADDRRREDVARTLAAVLDRADGDAAAAAVLTAIDAADIPAVAALPLVGRLGTDAALARLEAGLAHADPAVRDAAIAGLCNWPSPDMAPRLFALAGDLRVAPGREAIAWQCLRASVRAATRPGGPPDAERLAFLQQALAVAADASAADRGYILERAAASIRTPECFDWIATHLDDPDLRDAAARGVVALARDRGLRKAHRDRVLAALVTVRASSPDPDLVLRAERHALGL